MPLHPDEITLAARTLTDADPPAGLEARIRRRLDAHTPPRPTTGRWPIVAGFATVMAMAIIVVAVRSPEVPESRGTEVRGDVPGSRGLPAVALAKAGLAVPAPAAPAGSAPPRVVTVAPIRLPAYRSMSEPEWAWMSRRVPALDVIDPIQPEPVSITPLTMTPLMTLPMYGDPDEGRQ